MTRKESAGIESSACNGLRTRSQGYCMAIHALSSTDGSRARGSKFIIAYTCIRRSTKLYTLALGKAMGPSTETAIRSTVPTTVALEINIIKHIYIPIAYRTVALSQRVNSTFILPYLLLGTTYESNFVFLIHEYTICS